MTTQQPQKPLIDKDWQYSSVNAENLKLEDVKFIFAQAEKRLDDSIKNFDATTTKSISFITLSATLLTALAGYFFVNLDPKGIIDPKLCSVLLCSIYMTVVLLRFVGVVLPRNYHPIGSYPQDLLEDDTIFNEEYSKDSDNNKTWTKSTIYIYLAEIENYNCRIKENTDANSERLRLFNQSVVGICLLPVLGLISYVIIYYLIT